MCPMPGRTRTTVGGGQVPLAVGSVCALQPQVCAVCRHHVRACTLAQLPAAELCPPARPEHAAGEGVGRREDVGAACDRQPGGRPAGGTMSGGEGDAAGMESEGADVGEVE